jgi:hypothetical protein
LAATLAKGRRKGKAARRHDGPKGRRCVEISVWACPSPMAELWLLQLLGAAVPDLEDGDDGREDADYCIAGDD